MDQTPPDATFAVLQPELPSRARKKFIAEKLDDQDEQFSWVWEGYLAPGNVTLLTSQWKSGKTTLISILLSRLREGGEFLGLSLAAGKAVVVTEESRTLWKPRHKKLNLEHISFLFRPFLGKPSLDDWRDLIEHLADLHKDGVTLAIIDTSTT